MSLTLVIYTSQPEQLWRALMAAAPPSGATVSGEPPDFALSFECTSLFVFPPGQPNSIPDQVARELGNSCLEVIFNYNDAVRSEELIAAAVTDLEVMVEDDNLRLMTPGQFNARTRAWKRRRQRWAPLPRNGALPLVPLLAHVGGSTDAAVVEAASATTQRLSERTGWVTGPPELVDELDEDGTRTIGIVLWLIEAFERRRFRRPLRIDPTTETALLADVHAFMRALETLSEETNTELELELGGKRVGQVEEGEAYQFAFSLPNL